MAARLQPRRDPALFHHFRSGCVGISAQTNHKRAKLRSRCVITAHSGTEFLRQNPEIPYLLLLRNQISSLFSPVQAPWRNQPQFSSEYLNASPTNNLRSHGKLKLLPTFAKECRKYGLALVVASQEAKDFDPGLFAATGSYLVLRVTDQDAKVMAKNASGSDQERALADRLKTMPKYEAMFFSESLRRPLRIQLSEKFG